MAPANGPYIGGTTISTVAVNARFADIEGELTDSLSRSAKGGMLAVLRNVDGTVAAPSVSFTSEPASGLYKAGTGDLRLAVGGVDALKLVAGSLGDTVALAATANISTLKTVGTDSALLLQGNRASASTSPEVAVGSTAARTAGDIFAVQNQIGVTNVLFVNYQGLLRLASQAAALQPASIYSAPTLDTNWTAGFGLGYWKDACGMVRFKGTATNNTGGLASGILSTTPLPVGFRPPAGTWREFGLPTSAGTVVIASITAAGVVTLTTNVANGVTVWLDPIAFPAEA